MPAPPDNKGDPLALAVDGKKSSKLGLVSGVYIPVCLNIMSILMFLRFGLILGQVGFLGIMGLLATAYCVDLLTTLSLSAIASNGEVKGGGAYYLISRSLGPEFGGSIGILFFLAQALNAAMNIVGLIDCIRLNVGPEFPRGYWTGYGLQTAALVMSTSMCLLGSATFSKASNLLLAILTAAVLSVPLSAIFKAPFRDDDAGIVYTGLSLNTLASNLLPSFDEHVYQGLTTFRDLFGITFPATSGIFAGASMSGDLKNPSKAVPKGTLWAMLTTFVVYFVVILSMACTISRASLLANDNIMSVTSLSAAVIFAGECSVTFFSALMGIMGSAKLFQALARDKLLPGLSIFGRGTKKADEPIFAVFLTYAIAQVALLADLNQIATFISMGYQMTFFVMNLACFLLKIGSAPNFRPSFKLFNWQTACIGSLLSAAAMFFIDETYAAIAICVLVFVFLLIHYLCPPKRWGDVSQNLIYHQVRKYLLRLKPEHIKFWRPHIILLINNPRRQTRLIQFCNSMKKGSLYILGHVIVTDDFNSGVHEARLQQQAWTRYISEFSRIKAFVQLTMSPSITWGVRNLVLAAGLGGMRPNVAVLGFYNMDDLRKSNPTMPIPDVPASPADKTRRRSKSSGNIARRGRRDTSAQLLEGTLPTDVIRTEGMVSPTDYMIMLEDLALKYRLNVAIAHGFDKLETPQHDGSNSKKYIDLWPIQMSAELSSDGKNVLTTNFDTYTLILQLGHILRSVQAWQRVFALRVLVFVEYAHEVDEERARVQALLEKLRIDAQVLVFYLASGHLNTYELIVNGSTDDIDAEIIVGEALKDEEWWEDLQMLRRRTEELSSSQELSQLAQFLDSTSARPGAYNPHDDAGNARRQSMAEVAEMPRKPDIATLSKLGVSMGIHTTHINDEVLQEPESTQTLIQMWKRLLLEPSQESGAATGQPSSTPGRGRMSRTGDPSTQVPSYGTMEASRTLAENPEASVGLRVPEVAEMGTSSPGADKGPHQFDSFPTLDPLRVPSSGVQRSRSTSPSKVGDGAGAVTPTRPNFSRQSSAARFSSRPVPETKIIAEGEGTKLSFAPTASNPPTPGAERPAFSRQSSLGKFSSRLLPETKVSGVEGARTITFASPPASQPHSGPHSRHHSRHGSQYSVHRQDPVSLVIPEHAEAFTGHVPNHGSEADTGSAFSGRNVTLSFNDLPSRAQHLILNELMRQHSKLTSVLMTTLPIPSEGTSLDETSTMQYLSDVELFCNKLPPTLMVLSNTMTVTVSL
ncbi:cation chloride cotransporter [Metarhizium album ARSEF 1941]|uniref:Cation chloride cotransporter n=1 Tax=Metarhizium album (strain ARSEF 1941) TaxID=1081103 RepID=A0A0B2X4I9_METAS|nr:cation chloride cotransporter [Metarhizium album ARSEF 1941]KHO00350.1 cation chloride cotransporter [Metarhizium album ARSEF 1941]